MLDELYEENGDESASTPEAVPEARAPADEAADKPAEETADQPSEETADETAEDGLWASPRPGEDELAAVLSAAVSSAEQPQPAPDEPARDGTAVVADVAPVDPPPVRLRPRDRGTELPDQAVPGLASSPDAGTDDEPELEAEPRPEPTLPVEVPRPAEELPTARLHAVGEATAEVPLESGFAWQRSDDDVLPGRRAGSGLRLRHGLTRSGPRLFHRPRRRR